MIQNVGIDLVEIKRIKEAIKKWENKFLHRVFKNSEIILPQHSGNTSNRIIFNIIKRDKACINFLFHITFSTFDYILKIFLLFQKKNTYPFDNELILISL